MIMFFTLGKKKSSAIASAPPIKMLLCCKWNQPRASLLLMCSQACFSLFTVYFTCEYLPGMTLYYLTLLCTPSLLRKKMPREKKWSKCHSWIGMHSWIWRIYYCTHPTPQQYTCQGAGKYRRKPALKYLIKHIKYNSRWSVFVHCFAQGYLWRHIQVSSELWWILDEQNQEFSSHGKKKSHKNSNPVLILLFFSDFKHSDFYFLKHNPSCCSSVPVFCIQHNHSFVNEGCKQFVLPHKT